MAEKNEKILADGFFSSKMVTEILCEKYTSCYFVLVCNIRFFWENNKMKKKR